MVNVPPAPPSLHTAAVALPPNEPPKVVVVPPWQTATNPVPALAVGDAVTLTVLPAETLPHEPPEVVNVSVTVAGAPAAAV